MYKQIAIAALIAGPLIADLAARHTGAQAPAVPANATEVAAPASGQSTPSHVVLPQPSPVTAPSLAGQLNPTGGIDPTPALDPTPAGSSAMQPPPQAVAVGPSAPAPVVQEAPTEPSGAPAVTYQPPAPPPAF